MLFEVIKDPAKCQLSDFKENYSNPDCMFKSVELKYRWSIQSAVEHVQPIYPTDGEPTSLTSLKENMTSQPTLFMGSLYMTSLTSLIFLTLQTWTKNSSGEAEESEEKIQMIGCW